MPIYEYQCQKCEHRLDALQRIGAEALTDCPECGKAALRKLVSAPGFRLKGSGWYETDFKTGNKKNLAGDAKAADKTVSGNGKDSKKTEAKPAKTESAKSSKSGSAGSGKAD